MGRQKGARRPAFFGAVRELCGSAVHGARCADVGRKGRAAPATDRVAARPVGASTRTAGCRAVAKLGGARPGLTVRVCGGLPGGASER